MSCSPLVRPSARGWHRLRLERSSPFERRARQDHTGTYRDKREEQVRPMSVHDAIRQAESLLPGEPAAEDQRDPRWRAIIAVEEYIATEPEAVWDFIRIWGDHPQEDLRLAVATCLLEHLLEYHFTAFFPKVEQLSASSLFFADTFLTCWRFGQSREPENLARFERLIKRLEKRQRRRRSL